LKFRKDNSINIKKYKNRREWNVGIVIFMIIFIYLVVTIFTYATSKKVYAYEVRKGSIVKDNSYIGLAIRQESVIKTETGGYINYYQNENSKVKAGASVYTVSDQKLKFPAKDTSEETAALSEDLQNNLILQMQQFNENYDPQKYSSVYSLKNEITALMQTSGSKTKTSQLSAVIEASGLEVTSFQTSQDGILVLTVDGYEGLTKDSFTEKDFDRSSYESIQLNDQMKIEAGDPVYKLVTGEKWSVLVQLDETTAKSLQDVTSMKTRIDKDSETMWADFSIIEKDGAYYGCLDFDNSMIRYAQERYLNMELIFEDETGLKIPRTAVVEKEFFTIPKEYITTGGNSSSPGVLVQTEGNSAQFTPIEIYDISESGEVYVSTADFTKGTTFIKPESAETYTLRETKPLKGVYNINQGYAVFKEVDILCESDEYYIVREGDTYGLNNYDHIVQNGDSMKEDEIVFQ
jgi:hypothetical protein